MSEGGEMDKRNPLDQGGRQEAGCVDGEKEPMNPQYTKNLDERREKNDEFIKKKPLVDQGKKDSKGSLGRKLWRKCCLVSIEPVMFFYSFAYCMHWPMEQAFIYKRLCSDRFNDSFICDNLNNITLKEEEDLVQSDSSHFYAYINFCRNLPPLLMVLVYGIVSDAYSVRLAIAIPCIGAALNSLCFLIMTIWFIPIKFLFFGELLVGFSGGWQTFFMASSTFISKITTTNQRLTRMSILVGMWYISVSISFFIGGPILEKTSFTFVFGLACVFQMLAVLYIIVFVSHPHSSTENRNKDPKKGICNGHILRNIRTELQNFFRKRPQNNHIHLLVMLLVLICIMAGNEPLIVLTYLFLKRQPLSWSQNLYGYWNCYSSILRGCGLLFLSPALKARRLPDTVIFSMAITSMILYQLMFGLSTKTWMVFIGPALGILSDTAYSGFRAIVSCLVDPNELGKVFALIGSLQSISEMLFSLMNSWLYPATLSFWPGTCFALGSLFLVIPILVAWWLQKSLKRHAHEENKKTDNHNMEIQADHKLDLNINKTTGIQIADKLSQSVTDV